MGAWLSAIVLLFKAVIEVVPLLNRFMENRAKEDALKAKQDKDARNEKAVDDITNNPS